MKYSNIEDNGSSGSKVAQNTFARLTASVLDKLVFLALMLYFTRYMGANIYGEYLSVMAFIFIFRMFVIFGMNKLLLRDLARYPDKIQGYLDNSVVLSVGLSFIFYIVLILTVKLFRYPEEIIYLISIAGISLLPFSIALIFESVLHAMQYMGKTSIWLFINSFLTSIGTIIVLHLGYGLKGVFILLFFVNLLYACGLYFTLLQVKIRPRVKCNTDIISHMMKSALPFALFSIMCMICNSTGIVMLSKMESSEVVGLFGASYRFTEMLMIIPGSLALALFPVMSKHFRQSLEALKQSYEKAFRYLLIIALPLAFSISIMAKPIIGLLFGANFLPSAPVLSILVWATLIMFINVPAALVVVNSNYFHRLVKYYFFYLLLSIGINYLLISEYSYMGAGIAKLTTEVIMFLIQGYFLFLVFDKVPNLLKLSVRPLAAACLAGTALIFLKDLPLILSLSSGFLIYFAILFIMREFSKEDIAKLKDIYLNIKTLLEKTSG